MPHGFPEPDEAQELLQRSMAMMDSLTIPDFGHDPVCGHDEHGVVTAVVGPDMYLRSVTVASGWRKHIEPGQLGPAVLDAVRVAGRQLLPVAQLAPAPEELMRQVAGQAPAQMMRTIQRYLDQLPAATLPPLPADPAAAREQRAGAEAILAETKAAFQGAPMVAAEDFADQLARFAGPFTHLEQLVDSAMPDQGSQSWFAPRRIYCHSRRAYLDFCEGMPVDIGLDRNWLNNQSGTALTEAFTEIIDQVRVFDADPDESEIPDAQMPDTEMPDTEGPDTEFLTQLERAITGSVLAQLPRALQFLDLDAKAERRESGDE